MVNKQLAEGFEVSADMPEKFPDLL